MTSSVRGMLAAATAVWVVTSGSALVRAADEAAPAGQAEVKRQTTCPVMGGAVNPALYVDVLGKRVYVCCRGCIGAIKRDPERYIRKLEAEGVTLEAAPQPATTNAPPAAAAPAAARE